MFICRTSNAAVNIASMWSSVSKSPQKDKSSSLHVRIVQLVVSYKNSLCLLQLNRLEERLSVFDSISPIDWTTWKQHFGNSRSQVKFLIYVYNDYSFCSDTRSD